MTAACPCRPLVWLCLSLAAFPVAAQETSCHELPFASQNTFDVPAIAFPEAFSDAIPADAVIRRITLERHDVFDTATEASDNWLFGGINTLHALTGEAAIRNDLLFAAGDRYAESLLKESERLLRDKRYFHDARVLPVRICGKEVDVLVITRDVWSLQPAASFSRKGGRSTSSVAIRETNLLGWGKRLSLEHERGLEREAMKTVYDDPALFGSRAELRIEHHDTSDGQQQIVRLERPFFALDARWSAGAHYESGELAQRIHDAGETTTGFLHDRFLAEGWFGFSRGLHDGNVTRWRIGATVESAAFTPNGFTDPAAPFPADRHHAWPWIEWRGASPAYETRHNFDFIGVTEDVDFGSSAYLRLGWSDTAFDAMTDDAAIRFGARWTMTRGAHHVLGIGLEGGGFWAHARGWTQARGHIDIEYHNIVSAAYTNYGRLYHEAGIRMPVDQPLYSGGLSGLRGYPAHFLRSERRSLLQLERRFFTEWHVFRLLRVGFASFVDAGHTRDQHGENRFLADAGFGIRIASSRAWSQNILHIDLAFPLSEKAGLAPYLLSVQVRETF